MRLFRRNKVPFPEAAVPLYDYEGKKLGVEVYASSVTVLFSFEGNLFILNSSSMRIVYHFIVPLFTGLNAYDEVRWFLL